MEVIKKQKGGPDTYKHCFAHALLGFICLHYMDGVAFD